MKTTQLLSGFVLISSVATLSAQVPPTAVQQSEQFRRQQEIRAPAMSLGGGESVPELYPGENEDVGPQRVLQLKPRRTLFEVAVDSQYFWSDNVTLAGNNEQDSTIWVNTFQAAFAPSGLTYRDREIHPRIGVRGQWYNYGLDGGNNNLGNFDFHAQTLFLDTRYNFAEHWYAFLGVDFARLTDQDDYDEFYSEIAPNWGLQWLRPIDNTKAIGIGYRGYYHFSDTEAIFTPSNVNDRTDHSLILSYTQEILPRLVMQPFYRFQYTYYTEANHRHDTLHDFGLSLAYHFTSWASVRTFALYQIKNSGKETVLPDYEKLDVGIGASLNFRF